MLAISDKVAGRVDALVGDGIEAAVSYKHRRRLDRLGWGHVLRPRAPGVFADADPSPRAGCRLQVLIDGANALPELADALTGAKRFVHITGWELDPAFELVHGRPDTAVGVMLAELAQRLEVRVLVWAGSPLPVFRPTRDQISRGLCNLTRGTRIQARADPREHPLHCHHEKTVVIDGEVAFVGGIDLTADSGDRFDSQAHPARRRRGWHDVATRLSGPAVADVNDHFRARWTELTGEPLPGAPAQPTRGGTTVQVVRTIAEDMYTRVPRGDFRVLESYTRMLSSATELIYLESQFLWAPEVVSIIAEKLRNPPTPAFRVVIVLPARANNGADQTRGQIGVLLDADHRSGRFLAATIRSLSPLHDRADPLYVHAKVGVVDDRWLIVGSANLNAHSFFNDTEVCVATDDAALARDTRVRLWAEHLQLDEAYVARQPVATLVDEHWRPEAAEQLARMRAGDRPTHRLLELPGVSRRSRRLLGPLSGLLDDG